MLLGDVRHYRVEVLQDGLELLQAQLVLPGEHCREVCAAGSCGLRLLALLLHRLVGGNRCTAAFLGLLEFRKRELENKLECRRHHHLLVVTVWPWLCQERVDGADGGAVLLDDDEVLVLHCILPDRVIVIDVHDRDEDVSDEAEEAFIQWHRRPSRLWRIRIARVLTHDPACRAHHEFQVMGACQALRKVWPSILDSGGFLKPVADFPPWHGTTWLAPQELAVDNQVLPVVHSNGVLAG
mmetsp:Transcript_81406/g.141315  ORF Transcript_81406/g.141315 Transcript_81406/m.141315 type:complete len:239 (-) Transcript_81406:943-1659(-)